MLILLPGNEAACRTPKFNPGRSHIPKFTSSRSKPICDDMTAVLADWIPEPVGAALGIPATGKHCGTLPDWREYAARGGRYALNEIIQHLGGWDMACVHALLDIPPPPPPAFGCHLKSRSMFTRITSPDDATGIQAGLTKQIPSLVQFLHEGDPAASTVFPYPYEIHHYTTFRYIDILAAFDCDLLEMHSWYEDKVCQALGVCLCGTMLVDGRCPRCDS